MPYNIYRLNDDGTGSWVTREYDAQSPAEALANSHSDAPRLFPLTDTYVVVDPERNPNDHNGDGQIVFSLAPKSGVEVVPASITGLAF